MLGDAAFPLSMHMLRPFPQSSTSSDFESCVFNYRLSRARRCIENAFGILAARWRIFRKPITASLSTVIAIVKASICLHNYVMLQEENTDSIKKYCYTEFVDSQKKGDFQEGVWRTITRKDTGLIDINDLESSNVSTSPTDLRDELKEYFVTNGQVPWQWEAANK